MVLSVASATGIFRLLDELISQTKLRNITWEPEGLWTFEYRGSDAKVVLASIDQDGELPLSIEISSLTSGVRNIWKVELVSGPSERAFDDKVRELWGLVSNQHDPIASLLRDLENLPPF